VHDDDAFARLHQHADIIEGWQIGERLAPDHRASVRAAREARPALAVTPVERRPRGDRCRPCYDGLTAPPPAYCARTEVEMTWFTKLAQQVRDLAQRGTPSADAPPTPDPAPAQSAAPAPAPSTTGAALVPGAFAQMTDAEQALSNL